MSIRYLWLLIYLFSQPFVSLIAENHIIPVSSVYVDAEGMNIQPGDTIFLEAGFKPYFMMKNFAGSEEEYLTIINWRQRDDRRLP